MVIATAPRPTALAFRPMRRSDLEAVLTIELRAFPQPWSRAFFEKELAAPQARCTVAMVAGPSPERLVGYTVVWRVLDELHLLNVAVHPDLRGQGIGRELLEELIAEGRRHGGRAVYLEVRAGNLVARRLYRRLGFRDLGVRRGYYGPGQDAIVMELRFGTVP